MTRKGQMTLAKAAKIAGVATTTLRHAAQVGKLKATKHKTLRGDVWTTTADDLAEWLRTRKMGRPPKNG